MKQKKKKSPHLRIERLFHEPSRLAIMSALCGADDGLTFNDLKQSLELTDGNLSRHLKALEETGAIDIEKEFVDSKPRTTIYVTDDGREEFIDYLKTLEEVLLQAAKSVEAESRVKQDRGLFKWRRAAEA